MRQDRNEFLGKTTNFSFKDMLQSLKLTTTSLEETQHVGRELARSLYEGQVIALLGDLGSGKTTFVKGVVAELGNVPMDEVHSPTFTYLNVYEGKLPIYHFDLYRLSDSQAFLSKGFLDYLSGDGVCFIEWAERIPLLLPKSTLYVRFEHLNEDKRKIYVDKKTH